MRHLACLTISICLLSILGCTSTKGFVKNRERLRSVKRVAVLPFVCNDREMGYSISDALSARLLESRFAVIERAQFEKLLTEQGFTLSGVLKDQGSIIGKIKGVDAIVLGSASLDRGFAGLLYGGNKDYVSTATARMIDIVSGEVLIAATFSSSGASTMNGVTTPADVGEKLAKKLSSYK